MSAVYKVGTPSRNATNANRLPSGLGVGDISWCSGSTVSSIGSPPDAEMMRMSFEPLSSVT
jgi:hypothetical protein